VLNCASEDSAGYGKKYYKKYGKGYYKKGYYKRGYEEAAAKAKQKQ
jgi:hypothetical protein